MASMNDLPPLPPTAADAPAAAAPAELPTAAVLRQIVFSRAADLARSGRYRAAEMLLSDLVVFDPTVEIVDLLARIRAQQGRLAEAAVLWRRVVDVLEPRHEGAWAALARIAEVQRRAESRQIVRRTIASWPRKLARWLDAWRKGGNGRRRNGNE